MWINMAYIVGTQIQQQTPHPFHYHLFYYSTQVSFSLYRKLNLLFHVYRFSWYKNLCPKFIQMRKMIVLCNSMIWIISTAVQLVL